MSVPIGTIVVFDPQRPIPSPDGFTATVEVVSPSAAEEPRAHGQRGDALVVWSAERGWLCELHTAQPCPHTDGLPRPGLPQEA